MMFALRERVMHAMDIRRRRMQTVSGLCLIAVGVLGMPDPARAGTYVMRSCNVPGEVTTTTTPWVWGNVAGTFANDDCAGGGGFGFNAGSMNRATQAVLGVTRPVGSEAIAMRRVRLWLVARLAGAGSALFIDSFVSTGATTSSLESIYGPPGGSALAAPYVSPPLPPGTTAYLVLLSCSGGTPEGCTPATTNVLDIKGAEFTLEESLPPTATIQGGDLMAAAPQSGVRALAYRVADQESGVQRIAVTLGGTVVGTEDFGASCAHADFAACQRVREGVVAVDTRKVPDGTYPVSIRVTDAAANLATEQAATVVQVANGGLVAQALVGVANRPKITAAFAANRRSTLTIGYGRKAAVRGRLTSATGAPVGAALIDVEERSAGANTPATHRTLTTAADGTFRYSIAPRGPTRTVRFRYGPDEATARSLRIRVKASATLRVSLRGVGVRYRGRVLSRPLLGAGTRVEIQGRAPGTRWTTFARPRANGRGNFSGTYRLRIHRPGVRLQFRVRVPSQAGYPFVAHAGRPVAKTVH
jgi:hypothetical protein